MLTKGTDVIGLKVIALQKGKEVDKVEDLIYDPGEQKVKALLVDKGGWLSDPLVILMADVKNIGKDAVIVDSQQNIKKLSEISSDIATIAKNETHITKSKVITEDGVQLGSVSDIYFDTSTGTVERIEISQGLKDIQSGRKYIDVADIITIGEDVVIVRSPAQEGVKKQADSQGVQGFVNKGREQAQTVLEGVREKSDEKKDEIKNTVEEKKDQLSAEDGGVKDQAGSVAQELKQQAGSISDRIKDKVSGVTDDIQEKRKNDSVGRYLTVNILTPSDEIIARRGDMITHSLLARAEEFGLLNQILSNNTEKPLDNQPEMGI